jgi:hypothetical protein
MGAVMKGTYCCFFAGDVGSIDVNAAFGGAEREGVSVYTTAVKVQLPQQLSSSFITTSHPRNILSQRYHNQQP